MTPAVFATLATTVAVVAITPGPAVTAIVARAITDGVRPALAINAGVVTGDLLFLALAVAGMAAAAKSLGELFTVLQYAGASYLVWQGVQLWRASPRVALEERSGHETLFWRNYGAGLLLMFGHVQAMLFYAALLPGFVNLATLTVRDFAILALMLVAIIGGVNAIYAAAAARARSFFANERAQRAIHRVAAGLMFLAAVLVATR
ncbi:MAG TPA: LysE family translocator [Steroidobacteraceae bacterium]